MSKRIPRRKNKAIQADLNKLGEELREESL